jgi:dynein heavy chain, axonemal
LGRGGEDGAVEEPLALVIPISNLGLVKQLCTLLDATLTAETEYDDFDVLEGHFIFALTWSVGAAVTAKDRPRFNTFLQGVAEITTSKGLLYDSFYDPESRRWVEWSTIVPEYAPPSPFEFYKVLVPTTDYVLYSSLLARLSAIEKPVLFIGESGTAKSVTVQNFLAKLSPEKFSVLNINFSSRTSSRDVQTNIETNVDKRSGKTYGPPVGKRLMIFIDDMNMPRVDTVSGRRV